MSDAWYSQMEKKMKNIEVFDIIIDRKCHAYVVKNKRKDRNGNAIFDCVTTGIRPQSRIIQGENIVAVLPSMKGEPFECES